MKKLLIAAALAWLPALHAADEAHPKPGFFGRLWQSTMDGAGRVWDTTKKVGGKTLDAAKSPFHRKEPGNADANAGWHRLAMTILTDPPLVKAGETRVIDVTVRVSNKGKEMVRLDFPDSRRIDVLLKEESGRILSRWSDDQRVENEPGFLLINPGERIEYQAKISTREMSAGKSYVIEAVCPKYDRLHASRSVVPAR